MQLEKEGNNLHANVQIDSLEQLLLPPNCHFADDARAVINCWESTDVLACPGSGKTTVLMAKLKILADRMPLAGKRGICILSHTNVAIDEIKKRLETDSEKILSYPNFAGTLQSFVDTFLAFPVLRSFMKISPRVVSGSEYARRAWQRMQCDSSFSTLKTFIGHHCNDNGINKSPIQVIEKLSEKDNNLVLAGKQVARSDSLSAKQYKSLNAYLHKKEGLLTYEQAFMCAKHLLERHGDIIRTMISKRFQYVFVDEYQDCSEMQRYVLNELFSCTDTVVQKIGDLDQAIYDSIYDTFEETWKASEKCLFISETNRYGDEIARVLSKLRKDKHDIVSARGPLYRKPILFVYSKGAEKRVVDAFVDEIRGAGLCADGTYKAIGMIRNGTGTTINNYWSSFSNNIASKSTEGWAFYRQEIIRHLNEGRMSHVAKVIVDAMALASRCFNIKTEKDRLYTKAQIHRILSEKADSDFRISVLNLPIAFAKAPEDIDRHILTMLCQLCEKVFDHYWTEEQLFGGISESEEEKEEPSGALDQRYEDGITVQLSTVHRVKGETHDATLYLETDHKNGSDLKRIMPLLENKSFHYEGVHEKSRRCAYVGLSRPRSLLCVAMREKTYEGHEAAFEEDWKVVRLDQTGETPHCIESRVHDESKCEDMRDAP